LILGVGEGKGTFKRSMNHCGSKKLDNPIDAGRRTYILLANRPKSPRHQKVVALHSSLTSAKRSEFMYRSPPLGSMVTIIFPLFSSPPAI